MHTSTLIFLLRCPYFYQTVCILSFYYKKKIPEFKEKNISLYIGVFFCLGLLLSCAHRVARRALDCFSKARILFPLILPLRLLSLSFFTCFFCNKYFTVDFYYQEKTNIFSVAVCSVACCEYSS